MRSCVANFYVALLRLHTFSHIRLSLQFICEKRTFNSCWHRRIQWFSQFIVLKRERKKRLFPRFPRVLLFKLKKLDIMNEMMTFAFQSKILKLILSQRQRPNFRDVIQNYKHFTVIAPKWHCLSLSHIKKFLCFFFVVVFIVEWKCLNWPVIKCENMKWLMGNALGHISVFRHCVHSISQFT